MACCQSGWQCAAKCAGLPRNCCVHAPCAECSFSFGFVCTACTGSRCTACRDGYGAKAGKCELCTVPLCNDCSANADYCTSCYPGYTAENGACTRCDVYGCSQFEANTCRCLACGPGFVPEPTNSGAACRGAHAAVGVGGCIRPAGLSQGVCPVQILTGLSSPLISAAACSAIFSTWCSTCTATECTECAQPSILVGTDCVY